MTTRLIYFLVLTALACCTYDNGENLSSQNCADTASVEFSSSIIPILDQHCYSCHDGTTSEINLKDFAKLQNIALSGKLYGIINYTRTPRMPPNYKLDNCDIQKIKRWADEGASNN